MAKTARRTTRKQQDAVPTSAEPENAPQEDLALLHALAAARIAIEGVDPEIDGGRFPARPVKGQPFRIACDAFCDGHDTVRVAVVWSDPGAEAPVLVEMTFQGNDRWAATVTPHSIGPGSFSFLAWRDLFAQWHKDTAKKIAAGQDVTLEAEEGRLLVEKAQAQAAEGADKTALATLARAGGEGDTASRIAALTSAEARDLMHRAGPRSDLTRHDRDLPVFVDPLRAAFSAWYELMPRSQGAAGQHGTFQDVIDRLPYVRDLGFDVLYFPPIHPIGRINRKGPNNSLTPAAGDPGSPYAIGSDEGGHTAVHPELGTIEDFDRLVAAAQDHGLAIALDFAIQCAPDHPWIKRHPEWFDWRPDGTIKFAENPPKKYEDIVNVHFYREAIPSLWLELRDVVLFWIAHGVTIFRVDNPHTKPFPFWEWMIADIRARHPDTVFLAEAFTRPKVMKRLAKVGFNQSYSYFTWRNGKADLTDYLTELTTTAARHTMRPNFFVNTPDINPYFLQSSGRPGFRTRLVLAGTLAGSYGIYNGYEICEAAAVPGKEEYLDSEKYQLRHWDMDAPGHIQDDIRLLNRLRRDHPALQDFGSLRFYTAHHEQILCYGKMDAAARDFLLFHVNLDPAHAVDFRFELPLWDFGLPDEASIEVQDLIRGNHFTWHGKDHRLTLDPADRPYAIWRLIPPGGATWRDLSRGDMA